MNITSYCISVEFTWSDTSLCH